MQNTPLLLCQLPFWYVQSACLLFKGDLRMQSKPSVSVAATLCGMLVSLSVKEFSAYVMSVALKKTYAYWNVLVLARFEIQMIGDKLDWNREWIT